MGSHNSSHLCSSDEVVLGRGPAPRLTLGLVHGGPCRRLSGHSCGSNSRGPDGFIWEVGPDAQCLSHCRSTADHGTRGTHWSICIPLKDYFPRTCCVPGTVLDSEDLKLNPPPGSPPSRARKPWVIWHHPCVYYQAIRFPLSNTLAAPHQFWYSVCSFRHSRHFPCDFFSDLHMLIVTLTHLFSALPALTACLLCPRR